MKLALCFSGQPRYLKECYPAIYKNLLEKYSPDVFVHTWWDESMPNKNMDLPSSELTSFGHWNLEFGIYPSTLLRVVSPSTLRRTVSLSNHLLFGICNLVLFYPAL